LRILKADAHPINKKMDRTKQAKLNGRISSGKRE